MYIYIYICIYLVVHAMSWLSSYEIATATRVQTLDEPFCILHSTCTIGNNMKLTILPPAMGEILGSFNLGMATSLGEGKLRIPTSKTWLKNLFCVSSCLYGRVISYTYIVVKMTTRVEGNSKAFFLKAIASKCRGRALLLSLDCSTLPSIRTL